jgi:hypothetical protein
MIEITNKEEFKKELKEYLIKSFEIASIKIENEILDQITAMGLVDNGTLKGRGYKFNVITSDSSINIELETGVDYTAYLEYGTYEYFNIFGLSGFPEKPHPKKKDMTEKERLKFPKGMQPFAPLRRVLWNKQKMEKIMSDSFRLAKK